MEQLSTTKNPVVLSSSLRYLLIILLGCSGMLITGCQKEELQGNSQKQDLLSSLQKQDLKKKAVPFKANFQTTLKTIQAATDVLPELDSVNARGEGTHIGSSTFKALAIYTPPEFNLTGNGVITAANGDHIFFAAIPGPGPVPDFTTGNIVFTYQSKITGGTGRFADATGQWIDLVHASLNTTTGTDTLKGAISY